MRRYIVLGLIVVLCLVALVLVIDLAATPTAADGGAVDTRAPRITPSARCFLFPAPYPGPKLRGGLVCPTRTPPPYPAPH